MDSPSLAAEKEIGGNVIGLQADVANADFDGTNQAGEGAPPEAELAPSSAPKRAHTESFTEWRTARWKWPRWIASEWEKCYDGVGSRKQRREGIRRDEVLSRLFCFLAAILRVASGVHARRPFAQVEVFADGASAFVSRVSKKKDKHVVTEVNMI